ncbi:uncharacterized protein [Choristoneura fumiferana]|uniref:uncharacterized protein n=1 Tax=Choristoneura fumiferana TaxID=7141 RepID=UPI003D1563B7
MADFDLKIALSLIPSMTDDEVVIKQLIDSVEYYDTMLKDDSKKSLINFVLKNRLTEVGKLKLCASYDTTQKLVQDMKKLLLPRKSATAIQNRMQALKQGESSIDNFGQQLSSMFVDLTIAQSDGNSDTFNILKNLNEKQAIKRFADGLRNRRISTIIAARDYESLKDAIQGAKDEETVSAAEVTREDIILTEGYHSTLKLQERLGTSSSTSSAHTTIQLGALAEEPTDSQAAEDEPTESKELTLVSSINETIRLPLQDNKRYFVLPPRTESLHFITTNLQEDCVVCSSELQDGIFLASSLVTPINGKLPIRILNTTEKEAKLDDLRMSEGDVSLIHDEDVLRRMWQQTEDFSRKKEIRAHMYRLREERLRSLYSPEPHARDAKGCEFSAGAARGHGRSFADQSFQSLKSKEVRDAGSPPKEFSYSGQDLKELSNAGWNVESENKTTDDGHTHVKSVNANIEGRYDVEGGEGQFAAVDQHRQAITEYQDDTTSLRRNESSSNTAAQEQVVRQTDDGSHFSSTKTSSSSSRLQQVSSTKHESVPYVTNDDYALTREDYDTNNVEQTTRKVTKTSEHEQNLRNYDGGDLVSRKVEYPDSNTKVIVETRELADGTRVTSTRREFRAPAVSTSRSESYSQHTKNENKSSYISSHKSDVRDTTSRNDEFDSKITNIVDNQRNIDDYDFKRNQKTDHSMTVNQKDEHVETVRQKTNQQHYETNIDDADRRDVLTSTHTPRVRDNKIIDHSFDTQERNHQVTTDRKVEEVVERKISSDQYQTTYQSEFSRRKLARI